MNEEYMADNAGLQENAENAAEEVSGESAAALNDENENVFYLMLQTGKKTVSICNNVYSFENSYNYNINRLYFPAFVLYLKGMRLLCVSEKQRA